MYMHFHDVKNTNWQLMQVFVSHVSIVRGIYDYSILLRPRSIFLHGSCYNTNRRPSFLNTRSSFPNSRPRFWFSLNFLSAKFIKWSKTLKQFVGKLLTNRLSVFDHFVGLTLKRLRLQKLDWVFEKLDHVFLKEILGRVFWSIDTLRIFENLVCKNQPPYI